MKSLRQIREGKVHATEHLLPKSSLFFLLLFSFLKIKSISWGFGVLGYIDRLVDSFGHHHVQDPST